METVTKDELEKLVTRQLWHGEYVATDNFKAIEKHASVCFEDGALVAVTGKADDRESQLYAAMFADAPAMLLEIAKFRQIAEKIIDVLYDEDVWVPQSRWEKIIMPLISELESTRAAEHSLHPTVATVAAQEVALDARNSG